MGDADEANKSYSTPQVKLIKPGHVLLNVAAIWTILSIVTHTESEPKHADCAKVERDQPALDPEFKVKWRSEQDKEAFKKHSHGEDAQGNQNGPVSEARVLTLLLSLIETIVYLQADGLILGLFDQERVEGDPREETDQPDASSDNYLLLVFGDLHEIFPQLLACDKVFG